MSMTPEQMDDLVAQHFGFEATDDVDGVMGTLSAGAQHQIIPPPVGERTDSSEMRSYYEILSNAIKRASVTPLRRLYGQGSLIDETLWHG
ncbi:MAG: hypothetical protein L0H63_06655 [Nitrococcus sp.]|nr:hypothetical protein [Nitrococcus sp.]